MRNIVATVLLLAAPFAIGQTAIGNANVVFGNSLVQGAPWAQSGIPNLFIRGFDSLTCADLAPLLPYSVPAGAATVTLVEATNDVRTGVSPGDHMSCMMAQIAWLESNRPQTLIFVANVPPFAQQNCYGDFRQQIAAYNQQYAALAQTGEVEVVDVHSGITAGNGWAYLPDMDGPCEIHPGQFGEDNAGWTFFMDQVRQGVLSAGIVVLEPNGVVSWARP